MTNEIAGRTARAGFGKSTSMKARAGSANGGYEVGRLMRTEVHRVGLDMSANDAAQLMWEKDIGVVPVVDENGKLSGIVTDRDIAMAAYLRGVTLRNIPIGSLMTTDVISAHADDSVDDVSRLMSRRQVRRVPIVDDEGVLVGIVSLNDLAMAATEGQLDGGISEHDIADTLRAVCAPRSPFAEIHAG